MTPPPSQTAARLPAPVLWALVGAGWMFYWSRFGLGMTADTMDYLGIGRPVFALPPDVFQWPPAFWFGLQATRAVGLDTWPAAAVVLCGARGLLTAGAYRLGRRLVAPWVGHAFALFTLVWIPLTYAGLYALSETLFLAALLWWLEAAHRVRADAPDVRRRVWHVTAWASLMVSTRFLGAPLVGVEWAFGAWALYAAGTPRWWRTALLTGVCIVGPALLWGVLGEQLGGGAVGMRLPSRNTLVVHISLVGTGWWDPITQGRYGEVFWGDQAGYLPTPGWAQAALYGSVMVLGWLALQPRTGGAPWWRARLGLAAAAFVFVLVAASARIWLDPIGPRFLLPAVFVVLAAACHPLAHTVRTRWVTVGLVLLVGAWLGDRALAGVLGARYASPQLATIGMGGAAFCALCAWLDPRPAAGTLRYARTPVLLLLLCQFAVQGGWSLLLLERVAAGRLPSVQHPGWRNEPGVVSLRARVAAGDTIYTHTDEAVRAVLDDRRDVRIEPFCFRRLSYDCEATLPEYLDALDGRARPEGAEWIVICERVLLPYVFLDELSALALVRPHVDTIRAGSISAYRWPPSEE